MRKLRVFEAFCGYGSQSVALEHIGAAHEVVAISDIDADVLISYGAIRGDVSKSVSLSDDEIKEWLMSRNIGWDFQKQKSLIPRMKKDKLYKLYNACVQHNCLGDVSKINPSDIPDHDLFTYSFPCQDISVAGKQNGLEKGSGTRSGLLWECEKIIAAKKPKYLLMENVKNLVGKKHKADFDEWCVWLESQGYTNYWQVLNAKDYDVPQNRERVFMVSILGEHDEYIFPKKQELKTRLKDVLDKDPDKKFYLKTVKDFFIKNSFDMKGKGNGFRFSPHIKNNADIAKCITTRAVARMDDNYILDIDCDMATFTFSKKNMDILSYEDGVVKVKQATKQGYIKLETPGVCDLSYPTSGTRRGRVQDGGSICPTITATQQDLCLVNDDLHIRKLSIRECFKLMGLKDLEIDKLLEGDMSDAQLYKQAGNSIVVNVLEYIFKELFKEYIEIK